MATRATRDDVDLQMQDSRVPEMQIEDQGLDAMVGGAQVTRRGNSATVDSTPSTPACRSSRKTIATSIQRTS